MRDTDYEYESNYTKNLEDTIGNYVEEEVQKTKKIENALAPYRSVSKGIWKDIKVKSMDPCERYLWLFLITNDKYTADIGVCTADNSEIAFATKLPEDQIEIILQRFEQLDMIVRNDETEEILIKNFYKYNWQRNNKNLGIKLSKNALYNIQCNSFRQYVLERIKEITNYDILTQN